MRPLHVAVDAGHGGRIHETKQVRIGAVAVLPGKAAAYLVLGIDGVADASIYVALVPNARQFGLVIVA